MREMSLPVKKKKKKKCAASRSLLGSESVDHITPESSHRKDINTSYNETLIPKYSTSHSYLNHS